MAVPCTTTPGLRMRRTVNLPWQGAGGEVCPKSHELSSHQEWPRGGSYLDTDVSVPVLQRSSCFLPPSSFGSPCSSQGCCENVLSSCCLLLSPPAGVPVSPGVEARICPRLGQTSYPECYRLLSLLSGHGIHPRRGSWEFPIWGYSEHSCCEPLCEVFHEHSFHFPPPRMNT